MDNLSFTNKNLSMSNDFHFFITCERRNPNAFHSKNIKYYQQKLEKVKSSYSGGKKDSHEYDRNQQYIKKAEEDLEAVKKGRKW